MELRRNRPYPTLSTMNRQSPAQLCIKNGQVILKDAIVKGVSILIDNGKIKNIGKASPSGNTKTIDAKGLFVSPGFIDSHIHGNPAKILEHEIRYGTTSIVPAISCSSSENTVRSVNLIRRFKEADALGSSVLGLRLEGPYINKERAGAQNKRFIKTPSGANLHAIIKKCGGLLKIMTIAPELYGAHELIRILCDNKIIASIGHSDANYREGIEAIDVGATHATHLFNGMRRMADNDVGVVGACLVDKRVAVEIIFDLIHVKTTLLSLALTMKKKEKIILITDSVRAEQYGCKPKGGVYRLKDGTIAGSCLTMIKAIKNAVQSCGVELKDAVAFAAINPARLLGIDAVKGSIAPGKDADITIFDKDFDVKMTIVRGRIAYLKRGF